MLIRRIGGFWERKLVSDNFVAHVHKVYHEVSQETQASFSTRDKGAKCLEDLLSCKKTTSARTSVECTKG